MPENIPAPESQAITLREHLEGRISAQMMALQDMLRQHGERSNERLESLRREIDLIQSAAQEAINKAEEAQHLRNEAMNEWRQTVTTIIARYVEQRQLETLESTMRSKLEGIEKSLEGSIVSTEKSLLAADHADREKADSNAKTMALRLSELESWKSNMQGRLWSVPVIVGVVVFVITQLMRVLFPAMEK